MEYENQWDGDIPEGVVWLQHQYITINEDIWLSLDKNPIFDNICRDPVNQTGKRVPWILGKEKKYGWHYQWLPSMEYHIYVNFLGKSFKVMALC